MSEGSTFTTEIEVTVGDINYGGHVGNDRFLLYFHEARVRLLREMGLSEMDIGEGVSLIMTEALVKYKAQVLMGETLEIEVRIVEMRRVRFVMEYKITKPESGVLAAEGRTVMGGFDYKAGKISALPDAFIARYAK